MKKTIKQWLFMAYTYTEDYRGQEWRPVIYRFKASDDKDLIFISDIEVEVTIPDDFDPIPKQVAALEAEKLKALQEYQARVAELNEQLSRLLAITNEVPA